MSDAKPFEGTSLRLRLDTPEEAKKAYKALEKAGFYVTEGEDSQAFEVCTKYGCPEAALDHVGKVLRENGIDMAVSEQSHFMAEPEAGLVDVPTETSRANYMGGMGVGAAPGGPRLPRGGKMPDYMGGMDDDGMDYMGGVAAPDYSGDGMDYMGGEDDDDEEDYEPGMDYMGGEDDDDEDDEDDEDDGMDYMGGGYTESDLIGDPDTMPDDLEAKHDISPEYGGNDPEDLDLDLDVNEADYETGSQRKNTGVKGGGARAATDDANAPQNRHGKAPDAVKKGGGADTSVGQGETRPDQRKPKEGGSELPTKGRGTSEPQRAAKMAEAVVARALPDLAEAWRRGDARRATKILQFIERATVAAHDQLHKPQRTRFLQNEVARLEDENIRLRALTEAMAEVQRTEVLMYERKLMLRDHPELAPMEERLERCDTVQEMQDEVKALLKILGGTKGAAQTKVETAGTDPANLTEGVGGAQSGTFVMRRGEAGPGPTSSVKPLSEAMVAQAPDLSAPPREASDTATRLADYRRRRRGGGN